MDNNAYPFDPTYGYSFTDLLAVEAPEEPEGFAVFWQKAYAEAMAVAPRPAVRDTGKDAAGWRVFDLSYLSTDGITIGGWMLAPVSGTAQRGLVIGHGYGGREAPDLHLPFIDKVLIFPTRAERFFEYENLRMVNVLREKLEQGWLQLFCLDSVDAESFYCWWAHPAGRIQRHMQYEAYILEEVFPFMESKNPHECVISHGCSLGAFHAANMAFKHPHRFRKLAAFSGRYDLTVNVDGFKDLFDGYYDENIYFNTPIHFLSNLNCERTLNELRRMDIVFTIGEEDPFCVNNEALSRILSEKGIGHRLFVWKDRAHSGYYWRKMAALYL